jgi:hypothetical protein
LKILIICIVWLCYLCLLRAAQLVKIENILLILAIILNILKISGLLLICFINIDIRVIILIMSWTELDFKLIILIILIILELLSKPVEVLLLKWFSLHRELIKILNGDSLLIVIGRSQVSGSGESDGAVVH